MAVMVSRRQQVSGLLHQGLVGHGIGRGETVQHVGRRLLDLPVLELAQVRIRDGVVGGLFDLPQRQPFGHTQIGQNRAQLPGLPFEREGLSLSLESPVGRRHRGQDIRSRQRYHADRAVGGVDDGAERAVARARRCLAERIRRAPDAPRWRWPPAVRRAWRSLDRLGHAPPDRPISWREARGTRSATYASQPCKGSSRYHRVRNPPFGRTRPPR